jgi:methyl coenzyme M reductase subunit D
MRKELVWDGKHIEYGRRRSVDVAGAAMPMQVHVGENSGEIEK